MSKYLGDFALGKTFDTKFCTVSTAGAPTTLAGTPVVSAYVDNSTTEITAGITLTVDFDGRTGLHNVRVVATSGNGYATASNYQLVITTGTVGGTSVVGYVIGDFSIEARSAIRPTTADRTLDVSSGGEAGLDWANVGSPTTTVNLSGTSTKAVEPTVAGRTLDVSAGGEAGLDWANIGSPTTTVNLSGTTVKTATDVETDTADIQNRLPAALAAGGNMKADVLAISGDTVSADNLESYTDGTTPMPVNVTQISGDATAADNLESYTDGTTPQPVNATQLSGDATAADNAESFFDGTGYAGTGNTIPTVTTLTNDPTGVTTLLSRLTATRAGYLDNLSAGAVALASDMATVIARIGAWTGTGVNTLLGAFKAALSKTASTPSDIGGTFDATTDSTEAIRDRGDAAWTTATGFSTLTQADVRSAVGLASADLDTQLGAIPTAAENATGWMNLTDGVETGVTPQGAMRIILSATSGKSSGHAAGTPKYRDPNDLKNRIDAVTDADGNRTSVTLDMT